MISDRSSRRVVVAMSGGVDSSVSALLLHEAGYEVIGVSMQVWDYRNHGGCSSRATCCAPDDFSDARSVAGRIGVPYYVFDFEESFRTAVIDRFVQSYQRGLTPNPCVECNRHVKFKELRARAESIGASCVATGHFARIEWREDGWHLLRGLDANKDQSYFLFGLGQTELAATIFPVGHLTKNKVREKARAFGLVTAEKPESQDVCFVSGKLGDFLKRMNREAPPGEIVTKDGQVIGKHSGIHQFTVGQRKGLQTGGQEEAVYVLELDPLSNRVIVGSHADLERVSFLLSELNWCAPRCISWWTAASSEKLRVRAQVRYRHNGVEALIERLDADTLKVELQNEWAAVSPGQFCVFYDERNEEVLGGGRILHGLEYPTTNRMISEPVKFSGATQ